MFYENTHRSLNETEELRLFPTDSTHFSIIGSYLSDSEYPMVELQGDKTSLYAFPFLWNIKYALGNVNLSFNPYLHVVVNLSKI
ncbi:hypothetical protein SJAV_27650 [Sulfurisphaera javensis]|uniref:Uncharacterized protein n=1 Tax=Sulfurisphaera javensis TaxID=2049879 RepID=A0AAT9GVL4_9CREN